MDNYLFTSPRLGFRNWQEQDLSYLAEINSDNEVMRYFPSIQDIQMTKNFIAKQRNSYENYGYCFFATELLDSATFIGFIGFKSIPFISSFTPGIEIGWRLGKPYWNKGLATEGAIANVNYAFDTIGLEEIFSFTIPENLPSQKVMKKIGMTKKGIFEHPGLPEGHSMRKHVLYHLTKK